jgi:hypothetical protein
LHLKYSEFASTPSRWGKTPKLTEDPPFGGLWCDQPAIFLSRRSGLRLLSTGAREHIRSMDGAQLEHIHRALVAVQHAVTSMTFSSCDQEDVIELIDRVENELQSGHPNLPLMCNFLNSIARSLRAQPEAREACLTIESAIDHAGLPSTWQSGI